jgi:prepilin-type processing-associated H-X9-DG protein
LTLIGSSADGATVPGEYAINRTNGEAAGSVFPHPQYGTDGTGQFYSFHTGCVNAAFADGAVRTLADDINVRVAAKLVTRAGNEIAPVLK